MAHDRHTTHLRVQADGEDHEEEEHGPQLRQGHLGHGLGVHHKDEPGPLGHHLVDGHAGRVGHEAQDGEDDETRKDGRAAVEEWDDQGISVCGRREERRV